MIATLGRPVLYRDSAGIDHAALTSGVNGDGSAELWLVPTMPNRHGVHATPVPYSDAGEPHSWRPLEEESTR